MSRPHRPEDDRGVLGTLVSRPQRTEGPGAKLLDSRFRGNDGRRPARTGAGDELAARLGPGRPGNACVSPAPPGHPLPTSEIAHHRSISRTSVIRFAHPPGAPGYTHGLPGSTASWERGRPARILFPGASPPCGRDARVPRTPRLVRPISQPRSFFGPLRPTAAEPPRAREGDRPGMGTLPAPRPLPAGPPPPNPRFRPTTGPPPGRPPGPRRRPRRGGRRARRTRSGPPARAG